LEVWIWRRNAKTVKCSHYYVNCWRILSRYEHRLCLNWVMNKIFNVLKLAPLDGSHVVKYPLHLPVFWMVDFNNSKIKTMKLAVQRKFFHLSVIRCRQLDLSGNLEIIVQNPTKLLTRDKHNLSCAFKMGVCRYLRGVSQNKCQKRRKIRSKTIFWNFLIAWSFGVLLKLINVFSCPTKFSIRPK